MNKAFEETTMKNVPIDQFWSFKWRNGVHNWNLREKLSKIGHVGNFDFWLKVNAKVKVNCPGSKSMVSANGSDPCSSGRVDPGQRPARWRGADEATLLTWLDDVSDDVSRVDVAHAVVDVLAWLLTWSGDIIRWRQQQCFGAWKARAKSTGAWRRCRKPRWRVEVQTTSYDH